MLWRKALGVAVLIALVSASDRSVVADETRRVFQPDAIYRVSVDGAPVRGPADAPITIVEFSDFRCGACRYSRDVLEELFRLYPGEIRLVYKHFVIFGEPSLLAAEASLAAHAQGQFWAMHDRIFLADPREIDADLLASFAADIGLDMARYERDMDRHPFRADVIAPMSQGEALGLSGTPMFFVNGRPVNGARPLADFIRIIDDELKAAKAQLRRGVPAADLYERTIRGGKKTAETIVIKTLDPDATYPVTLGQNDLVRGKRDALVTIVLFDDFQCPYCGRLTPTIDALAEAYGDDLRIVFRHFPLAFHEQAPLAHEAAMAAAAEGKFWPMHDLLFGNQQDLSRENLERHAKSLKLNMRKFKAALDDHTYRAAVQADMADGAALGVRGTPTAFVNGTPVIGAQPIDKFRAVIDKKKAEAQKLVAEGVARRDVYARAVGLTQ